jgi:hypothetical protein
MQGGPWRARPEDPSLLQSRQQLGFVLTRGLGSQDAARNVAEERVLLLDVLEVEVDPARPGEPPPR